MTGRKFHCSHCQYVTSKFGDHLQHRKLHTSLDLLFVCGLDKCRAVLKTKESLRVHLIRSHNFSNKHNDKIPIRLGSCPANDCGKYICSLDFCKKKLDSQFLLIKHLKIHIRQGSGIKCPFRRCSNSEYKLVNSFSSHLTRDHPIKESSLDQSNMLQKSHSPLTVESYSSCNSTLLDNPCIKPLENTEDVADNGCSRSVQNPISKPQNYLDDVLKTIPDSIIKMCEQGNRLTSTQLTYVVSQIRLFMLDSLKDSSLRTARTIAEQFCQKYTKSFTIEIIHGNTMSLENSLCQKIYSTLNYYKSKNSKVEESRMSSVFDSADSDISRRSKVQKKDQYGCAAGQHTPSLPSNDDDLQLIKEKWSTLIQFYKDGINIQDDRIKTLIKDTYALQRHDIVFCYSYLDDRFFGKWPYLQNYEILLKHASQLIGIENIQEKWKEVLARHHQSIGEYLVLEERIQSRQKKTITTDSSFIRNTIKTAKTHAQNVSRSDVPLIAVIFPIIIHYFKEEEKLFFMVVEPTFNKEQTLDVVEYCTPILVVKGQSLWDEKATFSVVLNKKCQVQVDDLSNGLLLTFLCYFIYNLSYPKKLFRTLEFIQRFLLLINPPKGSKRGYKSRQYEYIGLKTRQFIANLTEYIHSNQE